MTSSAGRPANFLLPAAGAGDDDLQPDGRAAITRGEIQAGIDDQAMAELERIEREASVSRRRADGELVAELARRQFQGDLWDEFAVELVRYARSVLMSWQRTGYVATLLRQKNLGGGPSEAELEAFRQEPQLFNDLTDMTIARALSKFQDQALRQGGWRTDGGATLTTYFMGACLIAYTSELDRYRTEYKHRCGDDLDDGTFLESIASTERPEQIVASRDHYEGILDGLKRNERIIIVMTAEGYEQDEIAEVLGTSTRSVEGTLYRLRKRLTPESGGNRS